MNAKEYKKLVAARRSEEKLFDVKVPSGGVWKLREAPVQQFILSGKLPGGLTERFIEIVGDKESVSGAEVMAQLKPTELVNTLAFGRDLLLHCAVQPRIVENADPDSETEISPSDIDPEDFMFLVNWLLGAGGGSGSGLNTFRRKRSKSSLASANRS